MTPTSASLKSRALGFARDHVTYGIFIVITLSSVFFPGVHAAAPNRASAIAANVQGRLVFTAGTPIPGGAFAQHSLHGTQYAPDRGDFVTRGIARGGQGVVVAEQFVCAVD